MLFFEVKTPTEARRLLARPAPLPAAETVPLPDALGRVLAADVRSPIDLPEFDRSVVDGFAVRAADTFGASTGLPAYLRVTGEILMGQGTDLTLGLGETVRVATGGMLPAQADAVVMVEYTDAVDAEMVEVSRPAAPGENIVRRGDDVRRDAPILVRGRRLRPADLGAMAGVGVLELPVYRRPRIAILPTGDEIVPPEAVPGPGQVRDINSTALAAAVREAGGEPSPVPIVRDDPERLRVSVARALAETDLVLIAGGSSVGTRDWTLEVLLAFPGAELLFHGIAIRPGKPVIAVAIGERLVIGLPGNPVSALVVFDQFVRPVISRLTGERLDGATGRRGDGAMEPRRGSVPARMATSCASDSGKEDFVRVRLLPVAPPAPASLIPTPRREERPRRPVEQYTAEPVLGKSALIMPLVQADGIVVIPEGVEGVEAGEAVMVHLL
jgi:molybdopterin molybdotransferase